MKNLKLLIMGSVIGLLLGLWFGVNIGREKPIYSNPFADEVIKQKAKQTTSDAIQGTKKALRESLDD